MHVIDEKPHWNKSARIDHLAKGYRPSGTVKKSFFFI